MNDTSWRLEEFTRHLNRLTEVSSAVQTASGKAREAQDSNGNAFGYLFGWAVAPVLNSLCGDVGTYSDKLAKAMSASAKGIEYSRNAYAQTEQDNIDRAREVEQELNQTREGMR